MNNFGKKILNLSRCYKSTADIFRKQQCLIPSENLDNSRYVGMRAEVVCPSVYNSACPISLGQVTIYASWCKLISFFYIQVVQNLQVKNEKGLHLFCVWNTVRRQSEYDTKMARISDAWIFSARPLFTISNNPILLA